MVAQTSIAKNFLSASINGKPIKVVATATLGTTIHTAVAGTAAVDEIWIWAYNSDTVARLLTIEWGAATAPDCNVCITIPPKNGANLVIPGWLLQNGLVVTAFAAAANVIIIDGHVNSMS